MDIKPRIVVLYNRPGAAGEASDAGVVQEVEDVAAALLEKGFQTTSAAVDRANLFDVISGLASTRADTVIFNLCEALDGEARHEPLVAGLLDLHGVRFTGNTPSTLASCLDKRITKALLFAAGIPTPGARVFRTTPKADAVSDMAFPLVVKPLREDASVGITPHSFVRTPEELCRRVEEAIETHHQPVLGEVYLAGREFNVAVTGAGRTSRTLPVSEITFEGYAEDEPRLVTHDAKWAEGSVDDRRTRPVCPAAVGEHLKVSLTTAALAAYKALECRDYARVDLRLDHRGTAYVLEVNPNPDITRGAGLARAVEASGDRYGDFLERLVEWAWTR